MSNKIPPPSDDMFKPIEYEVAEFSICIRRDTDDITPVSIFNFKYTRGMPPYIVRKHKRENVVEVYIPAPVAADGEAPGPESYFFNNAHIVWAKQKLWDPDIHSAIEENTDGVDTRRESEGEDKETPETEERLLLHAPRYYIWKEWSTRFHSMCERFFSWD